MGLRFAKDRTALRDAVQQALQAAIADGTYDAILEKYGSPTARCTPRRSTGGA